VANSRTPVCSGNLCGRVLQGHEFAARRCCRWGFSPLGHRRCVSTLSDTLGVRNGAVYDLRVHDVVGGRGQGGLRGRGVPKERKSITDLLSYKTVNVADAVPQSISSDSFEEATEFGVPRAIRPPSDVLKLGYSFKDWDISLRATWKFLREATAEQVRAQVTRVLESDNKLTTGHTMNRLFNPQPRQNEWGHTVYGLWSGDGMVPPPYLGNTFDGAHTHYLTTGYTLLEPPDVEQMITHVQHHGYGLTSGKQMVILINPTDFDASGMSSWRANVEVRTGVAAKWDFIPSALMPAWISDETIHGPIPNSEYNGLQVWGSYGGALVIQSNYVPRYYVAVVATGGPGSSLNPVGFRQHVNPVYQGLRHIPGNGP
jgi:hypothetical protein